MEELLKFVQITLTALKFTKQALSYEPITRNIADSASQLKTAEVFQKTS
jgi:hypothetical protein